MKQKVIIDTNVLVSAAVSRRLPHDLAYWLVRNPAITILVSDVVFKEYVEVLSRTKFNKIPGFRQIADDLLMILAETAHQVNPQQSVQLLSDMDDDKFLELALEAKAHFLITGNTTDFTLAEFAGCKIVTPREYWDAHCH